MQYDPRSQRGRPLGYVEHVFKTSHDLGSFIAVRVIRLTGLLDVPQLIRSLSEAQQEIAALRARLVNSATRFSVSDSPTLPLEIVQRTAEDLWKHVAVANLHQSFATDGPLWRIRLLLSGDGTRHELILVFHHVISDGASVTSLVDRILTKYQQRLAGQPSEAASQPLFPSIEQRLHQPAWARSARFLLHRLIRLLRGHHHAIKNLITAGKLPAEERVTNVRFVTVSSTLSRQLLDRTKQERTTVQGTLCAAMLSVAASFVPEPQRPFACFSNISLRAACRIAPEVFGCYVYWVETLHRVDTSTEFWQLARECSQNVRLAARHWGLPPGRRWKSAAAAAIRRSVRADSEGRTNAVGISNLGRINVAQCYGPLRVDEVYSLTGQHAIGNAAHLIGGTLADRLLLSLMLTSPFDATSSDLFVQRFRQVVETASTLPRPRVMELLPQE